MERPSGLEYFGIKSLEMKNVASDVIIEIKESDEDAQLGKVSVDVQGAESVKKTIEVSNNRDVVLIKSVGNSQANNYSSSVISTNGGSFSMIGGGVVSGRNIFIGGGGGQVYINGKLVTSSDMSAQNTLPKIKIVAHKNIRLNLSGTNGKWFVPGTNAHADIELSGACNMNLGLFKGGMTLECSGASECVIDGLEGQISSFDVSGASEVKVKKMQISDLLKVDSSGASKIECKDESAHVGKIQGKSSGASKFHFSGTTCMNSMKQSGAAKISHIVVVRQAPQNQNPPPLVVKQDIVRDEVTKNPVLSVGIDGGNSNLPIEKEKEKEKEKSKQVAQDDEGLCVVCLDKDVCTEKVFVPCFHQVACSECIEKIKDTNGQCPMCRAEITKVQTIFSKAKK